MARRSPCPTDLELEQLLFGQPEQAAVEELESHFEDCERCLRTARSVALHDTLVDSLHRAIELPGDLADEVDPELLDRLCRLRSASSIAELNEFSEPVLAAPEAPDEIGRIGPYRVIERLGAGGMGMVYLARDTRLKRVVALKMILTGPRASRERIARFRREAELVSQLRHPNIVQVFDAGEHDGRPYYTMEFVEGGNLAARLDSGPLPARAAAELIETLARAVQHAHEHGIVHRDLKPANVLLEGGWQLAVGGSKGQEPERISAPLLPTACSLLPRITDFGLAKQLLDDPAASADRYDTQSGAILGTPGYMAPEQATATGESVGPAADVYALGAMLYEAVTGRPPFRAASPFETLDQVRTQEPVPPIRLQPKLPRDIETICLKCLEKDPSKRYALARELADDLRRFLAGEPIHARPVSAWERLRKWARRKPAAATLALASGTFAIAAAAAAMLHNARLRDEVRRAEAGEAAALKQQRRADEQYREARATLQRMLERLETRGAADIPQLKELQRQQLEDALKFYEVVLQQDDPDPAVRLDVALAYHQAAVIQSHLGQFESADGNVRRAVGLLERLIAEHPTQHSARPDHADTNPKRPRAQSSPEPAESNYLSLDDYRAHLADCFNALANIAGNLKRNEKWEEFHRHALEIREALAASQPDRTEWQDALGQSYQNMGALFHLTGRDPTAFYEKGLAIRLRLFAEHPDNPRYAAAAAGGYLNLGLCYQWSRQLEKAEEVYRNAQALLEPLIREHPEEPRYASLLASALTNWGMLLKDTGRPEESLDRYTRAVGVAEAIVRNEPNYVTARLDLLSAHGGRAQANTALKRFDDALGDWDRVIELSDETSRPGYRVSRAFVSILAGDHGRATAEAEALAQEAAISGDTLYNAACLFARSSALAASDTILDATEQAAIADRYAARAMELLRSLHASGYFDDAARATTLRQDTDLNTLRGREDFRGLQNEVR